MNDPVNGFLGFLFLVAVWCFYKAVQCLFSAFWPSERRPPELPANEQQRLGDEMMAQWYRENAGKTMIFGEIRAAAQRVQNQYPKWRLTDNGMPMKGPSHAEYL